MCANERFLGGISVLFNSDSRGAGKAEESKAVGLFEMNCTLPGKQTKEDSSSSGQRQKAAVKLNSFQQLSVCIGRNGNTHTLLDLFPIDLNVIKHVHQFVRSLQLLSS